MISFHRTLSAVRDSRKNDDKGFTLIELLVVILIIGVLAAIAIPIFLTQQTQAAEAGIKADLANAKIAYVSSVVGGATVPTTTNLSTNGYTGGTVVLGSANTATSFAICSGAFKITASGGVAGPASAAYTAATCTP